MNANAGDLAEAQKGPSLSQALASVFDPELDQTAFAARLPQLADALTTTTGMRLETEGDGLAEQLLANEEPEPQVLNGEIGVRIACPDGTTRALIGPLPKAGGAGAALAYERLTHLSQLSNATFAHPDGAALQGMLSRLRAMASGAPDAMQELADAAARFFQADLAAIGQYDGTQITEIAISGQAGLTKRAQEPERLRGAMKTVALGRGQSEHAAFAGPAGGAQSGMVFLLESPRRFAHLTPMLAATLGQMLPKRMRRRVSWRKRLAWLGGFAALVAVGFIPVPDGLEIPAKVDATLRREITAPFSAQLIEVLVEENQQVSGGETILARLDAQDIDVELIRAQSEFSAALLERESARAERDAARLRNAELETERLTAEIEHLTTRRELAELIAPISGIVTSGSQLA